jgi:hypothetical protein
MLTTKLLRVHLHDNDEYNFDEGTIFAVGQASFTLRDFLRPFCREMKLRSDVFPMKRVEADNTKNLDLNTTAKKNQHVQDSLNPYLINMTYCVIKVNLAFPITQFDSVAELAAYAEE